jgi:hypothetical protein
MFKSRIAFESLCSPMALSLKAFLSISFMFNAVYLILQQNLKQMCCSFLRKLQAVLNLHNNTSPLKSNAEVYGCKSYLTASEHSNAMTPTAESCTTWCS